MAFNIIQDTREQKPLDFNNDAVGQVIVTKLDTGDYSIQGLEDILCVERKSGLMEFYNNCTQPRFWREMERMAGYKYKFLIMEFPLKDIQDFPYSLNVAKSVWSKLTLSPQYLLSCISRIQVDYGINVIFAENRDLISSMMISIMKKVYANSN